MSYCVGRGLLKSGVSDRIMAIVLFFDEYVWMFLCGYAPHSGRSVEEKQSFYDELIDDWEMHG